MVRLAITVAMGLALQACAFRPEMERVAVDYNEMTANTANELVLLNIVRAIHRDPMHFTTITTYKNSVSATMNAEVGATLPSAVGLETTNPGNGGPISVKQTRTSDASTPKFGGSINTTPSFDAVVLNKQEFQRGIMQPISAEQINYFLMQGWPESLISALMIERVDFYLKAGLGKCGTDAKIGEIENDPQDADFKLLLSSRELRTVVIPAGNVNLISLKEAADNKIALSIDKFDGKTFDLSQPGNGERSVVRTTPAKVEFKLEQKPGSDEEGVKNFYARLLARCVGGETSIVSTKALDNVPEADSGSGSSPLSTREVQLRYSAIDAGTGQTRSIPATALIEPRLMIRSTQGILYFLGEYARADRFRGGESDVYRIEGAKLIEVKKGAEKGAVSTSYRGERFFVPVSDLESLEGNPARGMQVIDIVLQLFNLQQNATEAPVARSVSISP